MSIGTVLLRGAVAGLVAGVIAGAFAFIVAEPRVDAAIAYENRSAQSVDGERHGQHTGRGAGNVDPPVTRPQQKTFLFLAMALWGIGVGGLYGLAFAALRGRSGRVDEGSLALALCLALFVALVLVPALKYPPNPPGIGDPESVGRRTGLYFLLLGLSLMSIVSAWRVARRVGDGLPPWLQFGIGAITFVVTTAAVLAFLPDADGLPSGFPAGLLWEFRIASIGTQATLWAGLGLVFALLGAAGERRRLTTGRRLPRIT